MLLWPNFEDTKCVFDDWKCLYEDFTCIMQELFVILYADDFLQSISYVVVLPEDGGQVGQKMS
jgi:hypothetical protein